MAVRKILLLGNPKLYEISESVKKNELNGLKTVIEDLHDTLMDFRDKYGAGRAVAAPQIGIMKRLIYMYIDKPTVFINPAIYDKSDEKIEIWDDCMSFPELLVKVKRHKKIKISFKDLNWKANTLCFSDDLSELLQHEYDHLDGILAVNRAVDSRSFALRSQKKYLNSSKFTD